MSHLQDFGGFSRSSDWLEYKEGAGKSARRRNLAEAKRTPGGYKVLVRSGSVKKRDSHLDKSPLGKGRTVADVRHLSEARSFIEDASSNAEEGTQFYIRYSKPSLRGEHGYQEPNIEGYVVFHGEPELVWSRSKDKIGMSTALKDYSDRAVALGKYYDKHQYGEP